MIPARTVLPFLLISCSLVLSACSADSDTTSPAEPDDSRLVALAVQLEYAEAVRTIKRIQHAYAQYLGAGKWHSAAGLFAADAVFEHGDQGLQGAGNIERFLQMTYGDGQPELTDGMLNEHLIISPVITIEPGGQSALGRWRLVSLQGRYGETAGWEGGIFENRYTLEADGWKIAHMKYYPIYGGSYEEGWRMLEEETPDTVEPVPFHYTADSSGMPWPQMAEGEHQQGHDSGSTDLARLDARAARLLDEDRIVSLQNAYGYYQDRQMWDDLADLFHADASLEIGSTGRYRGRDSIRTALSQFGEQPLPPGHINDHLQLQMVVSVAADGRSAVARGTELQMLGVHGEESLWGLAAFENDYVKEDGQWQISRVRVYPRMLTDYASGWGQLALPAPRANPDYPADEPSSVSVQLYPAFDVPAFPFGPEDMVRSERDTVEVALTDGPEAAIEELSRKLRVLHAYDGAENVSNAYGYYIDEFLWDGMADVFSTDGWKELSYIGAYVGRERVRQSAVSRYGRGGRRANSMTYHQKTQPVITVSEDGRSARIRTRLFQLNSSTANPGSYISGIYENGIVNENGLWKIQSMDLDYAWLANYDGGWQATEPGSSNRFVPAPGSLQGEQAPDRPLRGVTFAPYPLGQVDMAFHYLNPVSGRKPPIFLPEVYEALDGESYEEAPE